LRQKQYKYYLNKLLSFENDGGGGLVEYKTLGEIALKITSGGTPLTSKKEYYDGNIPWLNTKEVKDCRIYATEKTITNLGLENSSAKWIEKNSVIVAMYGATAGRVGINKIPLTTNQACCNITMDDTKANYNYVYYVLLNSYEKLFLWYLVGHKKI
ncbi:restriction endonuclease subunit S, partial [Helicobacter cappadocius]